MENKNLIYIGVGLVAYILAYKYYKKLQESKKANSVKTTSVGDPTCKAGETLVETTVDCVKAPCNVIKSCVIPQTAIKA